MQLWHKPIFIKTSLFDFFFINWIMPWILVHAQSLQWYLTLCNSMNYSPPLSSVHEILQARILEWVAIPSSRGSSWSRDRTYVTCVSYISGGFFTTIWEVSFIRSGALLHPYLWLFKRSLVHGHLASFWFFIAVSNTTMNIFALASLWRYTNISLENITWVRIIGTRYVHLKFW